MLALSASATHLVLALAQAAEEFPSSQKIELVAKAIRTALLAAPGGQGRFLCPILASFAVVGELEGALGIVKQVKERQLAAEGESLHFIHDTNCTAFATKA